MVNVARSVLIAAVAVVVGAMTFGSSMWVALAMTFPERDSEGHVWVVALIAICLWAACACLIVCLVVSRDAPLRWGLAGALAMSLAAALSAVLSVADERLADERPVVALLVAGGAGYWLIVGLTQRRHGTVFH